MREIIFDTETTGFDPHNGDRMVEIGCIEMIDRIATGQTYHCYYNPQRDMPAAAENVHGLSEKFLSDKPLFADKADELLAFIQDSDLIAHNASFDFGFLNAELMRCALPPIAMDRMVDTLAIAKKIHPGAKLSLDALCSRYGIDRSHRVKHGALLDAELLAQLYIELNGGRQIGLGLDPNMGQNDNSNGAAFNENGDSCNNSSASSGFNKEDDNKKQLRKPRKFEIAAHEREQHDKFMATFENPLWHN